MHDYHEGEHDYSIDKMLFDKSLNACGCYGCVTMNYKCTNENIRKQQVHLQTYIYEEELELMEA